MGGEGKRAIKKIPRTAATALIRAYQALISSWTPARCRFYPTCSQYTIMAIERYGVLRGVAKGARRILRCHPWNEGGYDPLPEG